MLKGGGGGGGEEVVPDYDYVCLNIYMYCLINRASVIPTFN